MYCHVLPCTAMYCHVLPCTPKITYSTYSYVLLATCQYQYVPVCTGMYCQAKSTYQYVHHKSTRLYKAVHTGTYRYVPPYTGCIRFQMHSPLITQGALQTRAAAVLLNQFFLMLQCLRTRAIGVGQSDQKINLFYFISHVLRCQGVDRGKSMYLKASDLCLVNTT
jgi:hypothetical protein